MGGPAIFSDVIWSYKVLSKPHQKKTSWISPIYNMRQEVASYDQHNGSCSDLFVHVGGVDSLQPVGHK